MILSKLAIEFPETPVNKWIKPAERHFLSEIAKKNDPEKANATHHRMTMLSHLIVSQPEHADHGKWIEEVSANGPEWQQAWARKQKSADNK